MLEVRTVSPIKSRVAEVLLPLLSEFHSIDGQSLRAVRNIYTEGSLCQIVLSFDSAALIVAADENDDSVDLKVADAASLDDAGSVDVSQTEPWQTFIGEPFGWGWLTVNQQGYCDGFILSFGGITPQLLLNVAASSISVSRIEGPLNTVGLRV
jgi:hypothetical protein